MGSVLKPEGSIEFGLATMVAVYGVYGFALPSVAEMHATAPNDNNLIQARKKAAWTTAAVVAALALMTKDKTIFVLGGLSVIALDWHTRHAIVTHPETGAVVSSAGYQQAGGPITSASQSYPIDYEFAAAG